MTFKVHIENVKPRRGISLCGNIALVAFFGLSSVASAANIWYVDADNGNDSWDGRADFSHANPSQSIGPKKTLSVFTTLVAAGDKIYAAPGRYDDKTSSVLPNCRFYTNVGNISLISTGNASNTFIEGLIDLGGTQGCGANAILPVKMLGGNNVIRGFTITEGRQLQYSNADTYYGGGAVFGDSTDTMIDCVVTNCVANRGGGVYKLGRAIRCRFTGNYADHGAHAFYLSEAFNCVFENTDGYAVYNNSDGGTFVNCTCRGNKDGNFRTNKGPINAYNSVFEKASNTQPKNKLTKFFNCVFDYDPSKDTESFGGTNGECRVVATGSLKFNSDGTPSRGNDAVLNAGVLAYYDDNFPADFAGEKNIDLKRNARIVDGKIDIGAIERQIGTVDDNDWFVDAVNGDDGNTGKTPDQAKQTLVAIMNDRVKGDVVYAAPGVYSNKTIAIGSQLYRVKIPAGVQLLSLSGAERTVILGRFSENPDSNYGTGSDAVACVYCAETDAAADWVTISGFTLSGGGTYSKTGDYRYGAALRGASPVAGIMADCVVTNCMSGRGPVYGFGYVIRCCFYDNVSVEGAGGAVMDVRAVYDSYFARSRSGTGEYMHDIYKTSASPSLFAMNCTFDTADGTGGAHAAPNASLMRVFNSLMHCKKDGGGVAYTNCVNGCALTTGDNFSVKDPSTVVTNLAVLAITAESYRPVVGHNPAAGFGDYVLYTNMAPACIRGQIGKDLWGNSRLVDGALDVGAVACNGPAVKVTDAFSGLVVTGLNKDDRWHDAEIGAEFSISRDFSKRFVRGFHLNGELVDFNVHPDEWTYVGFLTDETLELSAYYPVVNDWYVDANNGNDDNDGLTPSAAHAFKTLARASTNEVMLAYGENESKSFVYVAEGLYDKGIVPANFGGLSAGNNQTDNRLYIRQANFVATGRREMTIIEGASSFETASGMGDGAVRCCLMRGGSIRGFTLRNGNVKANSQSTEGDLGGGVRSTSTDALVYDCEIHNCNAVRGGGVQGARLVRCYVHDNTNNSTGVTPVRSMAGTDVYGCSTFNSVVKGDCYKGAIYLNCTCLGKCWGNGTTFANCYVGMDGASGSAVAATFTNCVSATSFSAHSLHAGCVENTPCTFDAGWRPKRRRSALVDMGNINLYDVNFPSSLSAYRDFDYAGGPRVLQNMIDIGAGERPYTEPKGFMLLFK